MIAALSLQEVKIEHMYFAFGDGREHKKEKKTEFGHETGTFADVLSVILCYTLYSEF